MELGSNCFSRILEMKGRLKIGRKLLKLEGSAPGSFSIGVMAAVLKVVETVPVVMTDDGRNEGGQRREAGFNKLCGEGVQFTSGWFGFQEEFCDF